jgi:hypothetical protein
MSAIVIMELGVRPRSGCTLWHADDDSTWTVARNDDPDDSVTLTPRMVADALDGLRYSGVGTHGLGRLWDFSGDARAIAFRAAMADS